jgi:hypothetical protein
MRNPPRVTWQREHWAPSGAHNANGRLALHESSSDTVRTNAEQDHRCIRPLGTSSDGLDAWAGLDVERPNTNPRMRAIALAKQRIGPTLAKQLGQLNICRWNDVRRKDRYWFDDAQQLGGYTIALRQRTPNAHRAVRLRCAVSSDDDRALHCFH